MFSDLQYIIFNAIALFQAHALLWQQHVFDAGEATGRLNLVSCWQKLWLSLGCRIDGILKQALFSLILIYCIVLNLPMITWTILFKGAIVSQNFTIICQVICEIQCSYFFVMLTKLDLTKDVWIKQVYVCLLFLGFCICGLEHTASSHQVFYVLPEDLVLRF